jgi:hypothetical protein
MKKIISLFKRDYEGTRQVIDEIVEGAEWVGAGEGVATRKYDGTCCMVEGGALFKRYEVKKGKTPPEGFIPAGDIDPNTGKQQGWVIVGYGPEDKWHREAFKQLEPLLPGTYELCGPKVQKNPEGFDKHTLIAHADAERLEAPRDYEGLRAYFTKSDIEGIVWHHSDGRMVKIKGKDFGIKRD